MVPLLDDIPYGSNLIDFTLHYISFLQTPNANANIEDHSRGYVNMAVCALYLHVERGLAKHAHSRRRTSKDYITRLKGHKPRKYSRLGPKTFA